MSNTQTVGYIRVSSEDQNTIRQEHALGQIRIDKMFIDKYTGKVLERPQLEAMMEYIREGDTLVVYSIDRLSRSQKDLHNVISKIVSKGVTVQFIKEKLTFDGSSDPMSTLMLGIFGAFAEFERAAARERQLEGIAIAKSAGKYKGRVAALSLSEKNKAKAMIAEGASTASVARHFGVSRPTIYKCINEGGNS